MATYAKILKDSSGNQVLPYTRSELVYMKDGRTLQKAYDTKADYNGNYGVVTIGDNINSSDGKIWLSSSCVTSALGYTPPKINTTYNNFIGATSSASGKYGLVPAPNINNLEYRKYLCDNGKWESLVAGGWYFSDFVLKNPNGYIRVDTAGKLTQIYHVHINGNMVHVVFRVNLAKDAVANSMSNTVLFTLENMPRIWAEGSNESNYTVGAGVIGTAYGTNSSGMHLSFFTIENVAVTNASEYRFGNGINVYLATSFTYPAGNGLLGQFTYYSDSII